MIACYLSTDPMASIGDKVPTWTNHLSSLLLTGMDNVRLPHRSCIRAMDGCGCHIEAVPCHLAISQRYKQLTNEVPTINLKQLLDEIIMFWLEIAQ